MNRPSNREAMQLVCHQHVELACAIDAHFSNCSNFRNANQQPIRHRLTSLPSAEVIHSMARLAMTDQTMHSVQHCV